MKKTLSLILALIMLLSALPLTGISSFAVKYYKSGDWEYTLSNGKATVTGYSGSASNVTVPTTLGGYTVDAIDFESKCGIVTLNIPAGINNIEAYCFKGHFDLLSSINVNSSNSKYSSVDGVLFNKNKTTLMAYPAAKPQKSYTVPEGVTTIGHSVFSQDYGYGLVYLESVKLPSTLKVIEEHAFSGGAFLDENLVLPEGMTTIGYGAFLNADLNSITIPSGVTSIGDLAVGYDWIRQHGEELIKDFIIFGVSGSAAEKYAKDNKITFCKIGEFPDVPTSAWYYEAVKYVVDKGYMSGYQSGWFGPADKLKRQDFVVILSKIAKADLSKYQNTASKLKDVKQGAYYAAAVNWAVDNGIISGYQNGRFGVGDNITREQVATILYRYMGSPTVSGADKTLAKFKDCKNISSFAKTAVAWAVQNGIISGMADGRVAPVEGASRAQIAVIVMNMDKGGMFFNNWKDAYKSFILSKKFLNYGDTQLGYGDLQDISFALLDFNADSIPELVIYNGFNGRNLASNFIFTYDRRVVCYCGTTIASSYTVKNYPGMFASVWLSGSYLDGENYKKYDEMTYLDYYSLSSGKVKKTQVLVTAKPKGSSSQTTVFKTADSTLYNASQRQQVYYTVMHYKEISASWSSFVNTF